MDEGFGCGDRRPVHDLHSAGNNPPADHVGDAVAGALHRGEADQNRARPRRLRQDADRDLGDDSEHAFGADHHAEQVIALRIEMLAAEPHDFALDRDHFDADDVVGGEPVFEAVNAARILGDVSPDRAGDLARRIGRIIEPQTLHGVGDAEIGHAGLGDDAAVGHIDVEDLVELAHAEKNAVGERQRAARKRRSGAAWDDLDLVRQAIAHDLDDLRRRLRKHGDHGRLPISGKPVAFEGAQFLLMVDDALAGDEAPERLDNLGAAAKDGAIGFRHGDHGAPPAAKTIKRTDTVARRLSKCSFGVDEHDAEVVDIGQRRPRDDLIAERAEEIVRVVVGEQGSGVEAETSRPLEAVGGHDRACDLLGPVHAVGVAGDGEDPRPAVEFDRQRQQEFDIPPSPARARDRHRGFSAGDEDAWRGRRLAVHGDLARDSGHHFPDLPCLALERVAEDEWAIAGPTRQLRRGLERSLRCGDDARFAPREGRVAGLRRLGLAVLEERLHRGRRDDAVALQHGFGVSERRHVGRRRTGGDHRRIVTRDVRNDQRHDPGRSRRNRQPAALDRGQMLADTIDLIDVCAAPEQRLVQGLLVVQRNSGRRQREQSGAPA